MYHNCGPSHLFSMMLDFLSYSVPIHREIIILEARSKVTRKPFLTFYPCGEHKDLTLRSSNYREYNWPRIPAMWLWEIHLQVCIKAMCLMGYFQSMPKTKGLLRQTYSWKTWILFDFEFGLQCFCQQLCQTAFRLHGCLGCYHPTLSPSLFHSCHTGIVVW